MRCSHERLPNVEKEMTSWSDAQLLVAARDTEQASVAMDVLVRRHSHALERRCRMLTSNRERSADLAQETWTRMLRSRATLRSAGSFGAFLAAIAVNLRRDERRAEQRARQLSEQRLLSLDASSGADDAYSIEETISASECPEEKLLLRLDLSDGLARLPARLRAVVVARHVRGESAAEIGRRLGRTEQTITAWLREAVTKLKHDLRDWRSVA
jgi:RNA polymerase sigma factor (sigma-70 family)